ncbi:MAG: ferredoxin [Actinomycetes bacterium]
MRIVLDSDACTGHGRCYALAPDVFAPDDEGHCIVVVAQPGPDLDAAARSAVANCPEGALRVID